MILYIAIRRGIDGKEFADTQTASRWSQTAQRLANAKQAQAREFDDRVLRIGKFECKEIPQ